jgi:hypothetical protein
MPLRLTGKMPVLREKAGGVVPGVAERGAMLAGCFGSMFPRTAGESLRLAKHPHPALRADLSLEGEGFAGGHPHPR